MRENEELKTANQILREEFKRTNGHSLGTAGRNRAEIVANRLLRKYKSNIDTELTKKRIIDVFEYMSGDYAGFNDARDAMTVIGEDIMRNLSAKEEYEHAGQLRELKKELRETRIRLDSDTMAKVADDYGSYEAFHRRMY